MARQLPDRGWAEGKRIVRVVRHEAFFLEVVRYAGEQAIELLVMGTHGRSGLSHVLLGSLAEKVVRQAPCPVLTVRPSEHQVVMSRRRGGNLAGRLGCPENPHNALAVLDCVLSNNPRHARLVESVRFLGSGFR